MVLETEPRLYADWKQVELLRRRKREGTLNRLELTRPLWLRKEIAAELGFNAGEDDFLLEPQATVGKAVAGRIPEPGLITEPLPTRTTPSFMPSKQPTAPLEGQVPPEEYEVFGGTNFRAVFPDGSIINYEIPPPPSEVRRVQEAGGELFRVSRPRRPEAPPSAPSFVPEEMKPRPLPAPTGIVSPEPGLTGDYGLLYKEYLRTGGTLDAITWGAAGSPLRPDMETELTDEELDEGLRKFLGDLVELGQVGDVENILRFAQVPEEEIDQIIGEETRQKELEDLVAKTFPEFQFNLEGFANLVDTEPDTFWDAIMTGGQVIEKRNLLFLMGVPSDEINAILPLPGFTREKPDTRTILTQMGVKGTEIEEIVAQEKGSPSGVMPSYDWLDKVGEIWNDPRKLVPFLSSGAEIWTMGRLFVTALDFEAGREISREDLLALQEYVDRSQRDATWGYKVADVAAQAIPFAGEFLATGGLYSLGSTATRKAAVEALKRIATKSGAKILERALVKAEIKVVGTIGGGTLRSIPMGVTRVPAGTLEKQLQATLTGDEESVWESTLKAMGENWVEVVSESTGGLFTQLANPLKGRLTKLAIFKAFQKANPTAKANDIKRVVQSMGYHGVLEEMLEERVGDVGHGVLWSLGLGDQKFSIPSKEQLSVELVAFSLPGVAMLAIQEAPGITRAVAERVTEAVEQARIAPERGAFEIPGKKPKEPTPAPEVTRELPTDIKHNLGYPEIDRLNLKVIKEIEQYDSIRYQTLIESPPTKSVKRFDIKGLGAREEGLNVDTAIAQFTPTKDPTEGNIFGGNIRITDKRYTPERDFVPLQEEGSTTNLWRGMSGEEWQATTQRGFVSSKGEYNLGDIQKGATYFSEDARQALSYSAGFAPWSLMPTWSKPAIVIQIKRPSGIDLITENKPEVGIKGNIPISDIEKVYEVRLVSERSGSMDITIDNYTKKPKIGSRSAPSQSYAIREVPKNEWMTLITEPVTPTAPIPEAKPAVGEKPLVKEGVPVVTPGVTKATVTKATQYSIDKVENALRTIEELAPKETTRESATRRRQLVSAYESLELHTRKLGIIIPKLGTYYNPEEYLSNARQMSKGVQERYISKPAIPEAEPVTPTAPAPEVTVPSVTTKITRGETLTLEEEQFRVNNLQEIEDLLKWTRKFAPEGVPKTEPAPAVEPAKLEITTPTGIPIMITKDMEAQLKTMGITQAEINGMTPLQAWNRLGGVPEVTPEAKEVAPVSKETLPERVRQIHSELEADVNTARKRFAGIRTPDAHFGRLALNDANRLIRKARTLVDRMERGEAVSEEEVNALRDKIASLKDFYKFEGKTTAQVKQKLVDYIKSQLPLPRQGELLAKVKNVKTPEQLTESITRVQELAEAQTEKTLRADIIRELSRTKPRVEKGITVGRLTPEVQPTIDKLRASLLVGIKGKGGVARNTEAYEAARTKIEQGISDYRDGKITWDALLEANEELKYVGMYGMSTTQLQEALEYIQELRRLGKDFRKIKLDEIKEQRKGVVEKAVTEITGGKGIKFGVGVLRPEDLAGIKKVLEQPVNSQYGFVNLLDKLGKFAKGTKMFQGFLMRFANLSQRATNTENSGREATFKIVRDKFREIYGVKKTREATRLLATLSQEDIDLGTFKIITKEGVKYLPIKLTKAEMMEAYQLYKNPKNLETFKEGMHWTPEIMIKIVNTLTDQDIAWADWLQNDFYSGYYDKINPFYQQEFNIDMPKNPDYVPQSRDFEAQIDETDEIRMLLQDQKRYASVTNKSLKTRQENIRPFKFKGVFTVLTNHIVQMEHFMAWADTMHELRSTFGNDSVRTAIRQYHSQDILRRLDDYMNDFARGGVDRMQFLNGLDKLRSNFAVSVLALKPSIGLQQIWTVGAFMTEMKVKDFVTGFASFWKNPIANYKWMMENSEYIKSRYSGGNYERDIRLAQQQGVTKTMSGAGNISQWLLWQVTQGDKFGVMPGWWAKYQAGLKAGLSQADAMVQADLAAERTQNTSELASLSWLQRATSWGKLLTMFQSQPNKYFRIIADNIRNMQYGRQSKVKGISNLLIVWVILPMLFQWVADAFKWEKEKQARILILGPLNNILVAGQLIQTAWGWFTDDSFDWQVSPVLSTVRDFQNFSSKLKKIIGVIKDPYTDVAMDDIVSAIEFFSKGLGQLTGAPTPYLIMVERAIRDGDPRQLVFSKWALEEPRPDLQGKTAKIVGQYGQVTEDVTDLPVDKKPSVYDTKKGFSEVKEDLSKTLPQDVTEKNGFDPRVVAIAQAIIAQDTMETLPNKRLFEIIDDILSDNTLNYTFSQYYMDYQDRQKITSLAELKEWDDNHPRFNLGNVTPEQFKLMRQYEELETEADKKQFRKDHPEMGTNNRIEWLKNNPERNALLALHGQAKLLTKEAYNQFKAMVKELDIPDSAIPEQTLPPEGSIDAYFDRQDIVLEWGAGSWEDKLLRAKNPELNKWLELGDIDTPIASLELKTEKTYRETWRKLEDEDDPDWVGNLDDKIKDKEGKTARDRAIADLKATKIGDMTYIDVDRRIEAIEKGTDEKPVDKTIVDAWVDRGRTIDKFGGGSSEAKVWLIDHSDVHKWALEQELLTDEGEEWNTPVLRINAQWRELDDKLKSYRDKSSTAFLDDTDKTRDKVTGLTDRDRAVAKLRADNPLWVVAQYQKDIYSQKEDASEALVSTYVGYRKIVAETSPSSAEAKLFRIDHPELQQFAEDKETFDWADTSTWNIPALRIDVKYRKEDAEYKAILDKYEGREETQKTDEYMATHDDYRKDDRRREAYGLTNSKTGYKFPTTQVENYVAFNEIPQKGKRQERFLVENPEFANALYDAGRIADLPDPTKVPAVQYDDIYDQFQEQFDEVQNNADPESNYFIADRLLREARDNELRFDESGKYTEFGLAEIRRNAYGAFIPENYTDPEAITNPIDDYVGFYTIAGEGKPADYPENVTYWEDDWFMMEHPEFYKEVYLNPDYWDKPHQRKDYRLVPTRKVGAKYLVYVSLTTQMARDQYRLDNPDLDEWGSQKTPDGKVFIWTETMTEKRKRMGVSSAERIAAEIEERLRKLKEAVGTK